MTYRDPLPDGCPPNESEIISEAREVFRLVRQIPPSISDFQSQRTEKPNKPFSVSECQARGLSVFADRKDILRARKLTLLRGRHICRVGLAEGAGRIQKTGASSHHTWWPFRDYDILARCTVEAP